MKTLVAGFMIFAAATQLAIATAPAGWFLAGSKPANYDTGVDQYASYNSFPSAFLKARADQEGFGTLMQSFAATNYLGKRIRFSGFIKSDSVTRWGGLWVRVDGPGSPPKALAFDNMQDRGIKGTTGWQRYEVVLDVADSAVGIAMGALLEGPGEMWLNGLQLEVVSASTPITGHAQQTQPDAPRNLSFEH